MLYSTVKLQCQKNELFGKENWKCVFSMYVMCLQTISAYLRIYSVILFLILVLVFCEFYLYYYLFL